MNKSNLQKRLKTGLINIIKKNIIDEILYEPRYYEFGDKRILLGSVITITIQSKKKHNKDKTSNK